MEIEIPTLNMLSGRKASGSEQKASIINMCAANHSVIFTFTDVHSRLVVQIRKLVSVVARQAVREISVVI